MCLLSTKTSEEKNLGQYDVIIIENEWNTKRMKEHKAEGLLPMLQENKKNRVELNLGYLTWLSLSNWTVKTIMPCP